MKCFLIISTCMFLVMTICDCFIIICYCFIIIIIIIIIIINIIIVGGRRHVVRGPSTHGSTLRVGRLARFRIGGETPAVVAVVGPSRVGKLRTVARSFITGRLFEQNEIQRSDSSS